MKLTQILSQVKTPHEIVGNCEFTDQIEIEDIEIDSRLVKKNSIFFALEGKKNDGADFIKDALHRGAFVVVAKDPGQAIFAIKCADPFSLLIEFLKIFYAPLPANIYAITGTNGKTSTAEFTRQILEFLGKKSASIGTLGVACDDEIRANLQNSSLTTPDIVSLYKNLRALKKFGVDDVAMEVSSIGLEQKRVAGIDFAAGAFTNFTQDHLDYHGSMEEYFCSKMILFNAVLPKNSSAILNSDIAEFPKIRAICNAQNHKVLDYGLKALGLKLTEAKQVESGQEVSFIYREKKYQYQLSVGGEFQAFNSLCALGIVLSRYDLTEKKLQVLLKKFPKLNPAPGRMQLAGTKNRAQIFIDFAHTPDALENVLKLARKISQNRVLVMFGCGGDRDAKKRPLMGKIASELADVVIVTDDNPRSEKPEAIRKEILKSCDKSKCVEVGDRRGAITKSIEMLKEGDILILAGKGHEKYQIIGDDKTEFDEEKIVKDVLGKSS